MLVKHRQTRTTERGFTLTELAIVLGIVGLILGAIWVAAAAVYSNQRINKANTAILQTVQGVRSLYASQPTITAAADMTAALASAGVLPSDMVSGAAGAQILTNPWGGTMFVGGTTDGLGVAITMNGLPGDACIGLVSRLAGTSHDKALMSTSLTANNASPAVPAMAVGVPINGSVPPLASAAGAWAAANGTAAAGTGCTAGSNTNSIVAVFALKG